MTATSPLSYAVATNGASTEIAPNENASTKRAYQSLLAISFVILFLELTCIRWFAAYVVFLTFFTNTVLLASFLGVSVGCLTAKRRANLVNWVPALLLAGVLSAVALQIYYRAFTSVAVDVGNQLSPENIYFGTEYRHPDLAKIAIPMELLAGFYFVLIALVFVGLGQAMGRCFDRIPSRIHAYTINIAGSLLGILVFSAVSWFWLPAVWWFVMALAILAFYLDGGWRKRLLNIGAMGLVLALVYLAGSSGGVTATLKHLPLSAAQANEKEIYWSPYYMVSYDVQSKGITTNNIGHQGMASPEDKGVAYALPYLLSRDAGRTAIREVLIIGAGSGNDVAAALASGAAHVDAVEIDPVIYDLGKRYHPNRPYDDPRVTIHLNDGRNFLRETDKQYDLVVYALVDSLILHSGYSSIRLENYLFTREAIADVRARLRPNGLFVMYNYFRQGWLVSRLRNLSRDVFGADPIVLSLPYQEVISADAQGARSGSFTMLLAGDTGRMTDAFRAQGSYWVPEHGFMAEKDGAVFAAAAPSANAVKIAPSNVHNSEIAELLPHDTWPFPYLSGHRLPALAVRGVAVVAVLSLIILFLFAPKTGLKWDWTMFFLGAGFMLLETKSVVNLALLFGSTWTVNSVVFFAVLLMVLLSNLFVMKTRPRNLTWVYAALVVLLALNAFVNVNTFLGSPEILRVVGSCLLAFAPVFFAGIVFASRFRDSTSPDTDMGSNIAGVVLGGLAENLSMVLGFGHLMWVPVGFYVLSWLFLRRGAHA